MKLRKALDKAKQNRRESAGAEAAETTSERAKREEAVSGNGWKSPAYTQSRHVQLNSEALVDNRCVCFDPDCIENDHYKVLRTKIQQLTEHKGWNTVMITSTTPGEGKTLTAVNLALTFAKSYNQTVMLVDCDLRHQNVHRTLGIQSKAGLVDYLIYDQPLNESIIWPGVDKLTLMSGGRTIQDTTELLGSPRMQTLVQEMKSRYSDRYVLFDVPPLLVGADALALAPYIDCIVMVVEEGRTSMKEVQRAVEMLPQEKFIGFVMNRQTSVKTDYHEYYR